jgi:hypothetical protein
MTPVDLSGAHDLLEAVITAFSVLGGGMAYVSGFNAAQALAQDQPPEIIGYRISVGIAVGFGTFSPIAILALIIAIWT